MQRWITGIILAVGVVGLLLWLPTSFLLGVVSVVASVAFWEYLKMTGNKLPVATRGILIAVVGGATAFFLFREIPSPLLLMLLALLNMGVFIFHFSGSKPMPERVTQLALTALGLNYILFSFAALGLVITLGRFWIFLLLAATFASDTGAYLAGHTWGRHKLAPKLSPGKTIEGFFGGWVLALVAAFIVRFLFWADFPIGKLLVATSLVAIIGPLGDLSESLLKRGFQVKDSSQLIPGHGGLLDRVDALLFAAPVVYLVARYWA